jgi:hypothetical protein
MPSSPKGGELHIHVDRDDDYKERKPLSFWEIGAWVSGGIGALAGFFGGEAYSRNKLIEFDTEVSNLVRNDILRPKGGGGAAMDSVGAAADHFSPMSGFGPGAASHEIRTAHELNLIKSGKYPFARFVKVFGGMPIALGAAVVGGIGAFLAYAMLMPQKKNEAGLEQLEQFKEQWSRKPDSEFTLQDSEAMLKEAQRLFPDAPGMKDFASEFNAIKDHPEQQEAFVKRWKEKFPDADGDQNKSYVEALGTKTLIEQAAKPEGGVLGKA